MVQAGAVPVTWQQVLLEYQRNWSRKETYDAVMDLVCEHSGAYEMGVNYAYTMARRSVKPEYIYPSGCLFVGFVCPPGYLFMPVPGVGNLAASTQHECFCVLLFMSKGGESRHSPAARNS
jgi:hypothetical protein